MLTGSTRHKNPLCCAINATSTLLILRLGKDGIIGELPNFFDPLNNWPEEMSFLTGPNGHGILEYTTHKKLFEEMKNAAGLRHLMGDSATKLRSFGAMHADEQQASHPQLCRFGRRACPLLDQQLARKGLALLAFNHSFIRASLEVQIS